MRANWKRGKIIEKEERERREEERRERRGWGGRVVVIEGIKADVSEGEGKRKRDGESGGGRTTGREINDNEEVKGGRSSGRVRKVGRG